MFYICDLVNGPVESLNGTGIRFSLKEPQRLADESYLAQASYCLEKDLMQLAGGCNVSYEARRKRMVRARSDALPMDAVRHINDPKAEFWKENLDLCDDTGTVYEGTLTVDDREAILTRIDLGEACVLVIPLSQHGAHIALDYVQGINDCQ